MRTSSKKMYDSPVVDVVEIKMSGVLADSQGAYRSDYDYIDLDS